MNAEPEQVAADVAIELMSIITFTELLKQHTESAQHRCPGDVQHWSHSLTLSGLKEGCSFCLLPAMQRQLLSQNDAEAFLLLDLATSACTF